MRVIFILFALMAITSCTNTTDADKENSDSSRDQHSEKSDTSAGSNISPGAGATDVNGCYMKILKRDTFAIWLDQTGNTISGKLTFDNYEKDGSTGLVHGITEGDTVKLWYNFASEGTNSVMEVYFKRDGTSLLRGIGPVDVKGDTSYYTDHSAIQYKQDQSFSKIACEELPAKYK